MSISYDFYVVTLIRDNPHKEKSLARVIQFRGKSVCFLYFQLIMVNTRCLACRVLKNKGRRFHALANSQLHTYSLNDLRRKNGTPIPAEEDVSQGQLCHTCFQYISEHQDLPLDDSAWRMGQSSHHCCTFKCAQLDVSVKVVIPFELRAKLLMEYKFVALEGSRMCSSHITTDDFRTLVNQVNTPVHPDQYPMIMELQREYYNRMMTRMILEFCWTWMTSIQSKSRNSKNGSDTQNKSLITLSTKATKIQRS